MKFSICLETFFTDSSYLDRIPKLVERGFSRIEFWDHGNKDINAISRLVDRNVIKVTIFSGHRNGELFTEKGFGIYKEEIMESVKVARRLKASGLMILSQGLNPDGSGIPIPSDNRQEELILKLFNNLGRLARIAEKEGIVLYLEPLNSKVDHPGIFLNNSRFAFMLVNEINSPNLKVLYDIYHMQIMEGNIINTIKKNISSIGYIHVADVPGRHEPGTGELNYGNILKMLKDLDFGGTVGFELFPEGESTESLMLINDMLLNL